MDIQELSWLRRNARKFDKELRSKILSQHRDIGSFPCFLQKLYGQLLKRFRRIPVIIQVVPLRGKENENFRINLEKHAKVQNLELINSYSAKLSVNSLQEIVQERNIVKIYLDREVRALLDQAIPSVKANLVWDQAYTGQGITIAVLDTGVQNHPDFTQPYNRIIAFQDFVKNKKKPYDDNGHGTHCAGAALGNGYASEGKYRGTAYDANLVAIKVLNKKGAGTSSQIIKGLAWCLANKDTYNIKIISLSLGYKASDSYREDPVCQAVEKLVQAGIAVFVAAGNDGPEERTINSPGIHPAVITVGASNDRNTPTTADDVVAEFSSRGPTIDGLTKPDILAPGSNIISAKAKRSLLAKTIADKQLESYFNLSGTSMATPICAGIGALILEAYPTLNPQELKKQLTESAVRIGATDANNQGSGLVNALQALNKQPNQQNRAITT